MRTEAPRLHVPSRRPIGMLVGEAAMVIGFVCFVLGMLEIGGLFNLAAGLVLISAGSVPMILGSERTKISDAELHRFMDESY